MFIVAVTLGLLAVMGVYGLSATQADLKSVGHMREALQGQKAGEHALMLTAETFNPSNVDNLNQAMRGINGANTRNCRSAAPWTGNTTEAPAEACKRLDMTQMQALATNTNPWVSTAFTPLSFGQVTNQPFITVEVGNPIDMVMPGNSEAMYVQVRVTVFAEMKQAAGQPVETMVTGRGRLTVGPVGRIGAAY